MDRLAQSPLRLVAGFNDTKLQRKNAHKYRVQEGGGLSENTPAGTKSRKRRLQPLSHGCSSVPSLQLTERPQPRTEKARKEFELALQRRDFQQVLWLIESGDVPATYETHGGETALLAAIGARHEDAFRLVMQSGVSIDTRNRHGYTPLMKAIAAAAPFAEASHATEAAATSKLKGNSLTAIDTGRTSVASSNNNRGDEDDEEVFDNRMISWVLAHRPDLHAKDTSGQTAFDWAKRTRNQAALVLMEDHQRRLREEHADFEDHDSRLQECVALLRRHDALAMEMETLLRVPLLVETSLQRLIRDCPTDVTSANVANALKDYDVLTGGVGGRDGDKQQSFVRDFFTVRETRDGWTPLTKAAACGFTDTLQLLLSLGADTNHETARHKHTALTWASYCGHEDVVLALLREPDVDANRQTREGKTALHHAVGNKQLKIVRHLLRAMHERCVRRTSGKQTFHYNENIVRADNSPTTRRPSRWGKRPVSTARGRRKPGTEEWHDVFLAMLQTKDKSGHDAIALASQDHDEVAKAIQEELQHALQQAQDHAAYVATHQERTMPTPCKYACDGCDFVAPLDLLPTHELHACTKRRIDCERCGEKIAFETRELHDRVDCVDRVLPCTNREYGCELLVSVREAEAHARDHCRKRLVRCRRGCGKDEGLTYDARDAHETTQCVLRLVDCPLGCGVAPFPANQSSSHKRKHCVKRRIKCTGGAEGTGGCGMQVGLDAMEFHVTTLCAARRVACKWASHGCRVRIGGAADSRRHHEDTECPFRLVACKHEACGHAAMLASFLGEHLAWQCSVELVTCPNECGVAPMPRHLMDAHTQSDSGDCEKRLARCRLDLCGKMLRLYDSQPKLETLALTSDAQAQPHARVSMRGIAQRLERMSVFIDKLRQRHETVNHDEEERGRDDEPVFLCVPQARMALLEWLEPLYTQLQDEMANLRRIKDAGAVRVRVLSFNDETSLHLLEFQRDGHSEWLDLRRREYEIELPSSPEAGAAPAHSASAMSFCCDSIVARDLAVHERQACSLRLIPCPLACGQRLSAHAVAMHLAKRCNLRNATCRLGCGAVLPFLSLGDHELTQCERRQVACDHCHTPLPHRTLAAHLASHCDRVPRRCRLGCGAQLASALFESHEASECPKRLVPCSQCEKLVWHCELASHAESECALRVFGACDTGCGVSLRVNERAHHLLYDCALRQLPCPQCHAVVTWRALAEHRQLQCPFRDVVCRRGCGQHMRDMDVATHEETDCANRIVYCENRCGEQLVVAKQHEHVALQCPLRVVECPHGCGDQLVAYQCESHAKRCRQRLCVCGTGSKNCARPIRLWIHRRKLVVCKTHGETGLLWAIKTQDEDLVAYFVQAVDDEQVDMEFANGFSPLAAAASLGNLEIVKTLLRVGADVNVETSRGRTPLCEATMASDPAMVALLLEHRASVTATNRHGQSVLAIAESFAADGKNPKATKVLQLLREQHEMETDQRELFRAIACSDYAYVGSLLQYSSGVSSTSTGTLQELEQQLEKAQQAYDLVVHEVDDSVKLLNESIADTEAKTTQTQRLRERVDDCHTQLETVEVSHDASLAASHALEAELLAQIRSITALDIAALLNAHTPPSAEYLVVMKSICMFCGVMPRGRRNASEYTDLEWWRTAQALLMDRSLLSKLRGYRNQVITPDVMAKVRRECLRTDAFAATAKQLMDDADGKHAFASDGTQSVTPTTTRIAARRDALAGDIVGRLATWVQGVELEYKHQNDRATLVDKKRRLAVSLDAHSTGLAAAAFEMQVASRSLPARQQEVQTAQAKLVTARKELTTAKQRLRAFRLVQYAALNGHTALSFACAVGNDAMVHMLLTHGANAGPRAEDREACAALIQLSFREVLYRRKRQRDDASHQSRSDAAVDALVRNVAQTFLLGHYRRRRRHVLLTHRVPLHEAVYNGHASVIELLLAQGDATLLQKTHVFPIRVVPGAIDRVRGDPASERALRRRGGWTLVPLTATRSSERDADQAIDPRELESRLVPLTIEETLRHAVSAFDSGIFLRDQGGYRHSETRYSETVRFVEQSLARLHELQATQTREILARKAVAKKTKDREKLHAQLDTAIVSRAYKEIAHLLDAGAFADYETNRTGLTALSAACMDETLMVANQDGLRVRAVVFLLDRVINRPYVDFESSTGSTALNVAAAWGAMLCAQELLERGANVNYATRLRGETALMVAASSGQPEFVAFLLRHPATDVFAKDHQGKTALDHARNANSHACLSLVAAAMSGGVRTRVIASGNALFGVCKWGCGFMAAPHDHVSSASSETVEMTHPLRSHEDLACPKRIVECPLACGEPTLWAEHVPSHTKNECARRLIACPQPKCGVQVEAQHLGTHDRDECEWRLVGCECGERMAYAKYVLHAANTCPQRVVSCPNECEDEATGAVRQLRAWELKHHERNECAHRRVRCRNGCSASMLLAKDREVHETQRCGRRHVECKWNCGETSVRANTQLHHETEECLHRALACPQKCGQLVVVLELETHTATLCPHRNVLCSVGCGRKVPLHTMDRHRASECRRRVVACPQSCSMSLEDGEMAAHLSSQCAQRLTTCGQCGAGGILQSQLQRHREQDCRMRVVRCRFACYAATPLRAHAQPQHEQFECPLRPVYCPLGCGETLVAHTVKRHEKNCVMRIVSCGCGVELREKDRVDHEQRDCRQPLPRRSGGKGN